MGLVRVVEEGEVFELVGEEGLSSQMKEGWWRHVDW